MRLRDSYGDGRADQVTEFVKDIDSPRGLVWDHDRLYVVHPPHVSVFIDRDGDGVAEESKILINGDENAPFNQAIYVFDEVRKAGIQKVLIETRVKPAGS